MKINTSKNNILKSATHLFAEKGFDGTSIGQIAKNAGVAKGLIFHYFDNKATLWRKVKEAIVSSDVQNEPINPDKGFLAFLHQLVDVRVQTYAQHPELVRMMQWQHLQADNHELAGTDFPLYSPTHWHQSLTAFQQQGQLRNDMTVEMIITFIASSVSAIFTQDYFEISQDKAQRQQYQEKIIDCLFQALRMRN
ncbi:TetR/AcrR family transcriptional regulator [uncultured Shewanella sp.]|uniref:TetR/AcrR family transcriptional regulator n=1 Tax=uncultured Shewanella sp. TaxID=173975 RepID=UPI002605900C|nr:TetR/AcrR family transcriptional regulator [uncultured Shewanella sp.]